MMRCLNSIKILRSEIEKYTYVNNNQSSEEAESNDMLVIGGLNQVQN